MGSVSTISSTSASNKKTPIVKTMAARKILQEASPSNQISISDLPQPREELMFSTPLVLSKLNLTSKSKPKPKPKPMQVLKPNPKLEERLTRSPMYSLYDSGELTIAPLRALNDSAKNKVTQSFQDALNTSSNPSTSSRPSTKRTATESDLPLKKKKKKTTTLQLETRNEFELTTPTSIISRSSPTPPPNRIDKARSL